MEIGNYNIIIIFRKELDISTIDIKESDLSLENEIGSGTFGTVYKFFAPSIQQYIAIKVPKKHLLHEIVDEEIGINEDICKLRPIHPNIVKYFGVKKVQRKKICLLLFEYIENNLSSLMAKSGF